MNYAHIVHPSFFQRTAYAKYLRGTNILTLTIIISSWRHASMKESTNELFNVFSNISLMLRGGELGVHRSTLHAATKI